MSSKSTRIKRRHAQLIVAALIAVGGTARTHAADRAKQVLVLHDTKRSSQLVAISDREIPSVLGDASPGGLDYYAESLTRRGFPHRDYQVGVPRLSSLEIKGQQRIRSRNRHGDNALTFLSTPRGRKVVSTHACRVLR